MGRRKKISQKSGYINNVLSYESEDQKSETHLSTKVKVLIDSIILDTLGRNS